MSKTPTGGDPNASQRITCQAQPIKGTWGKPNKGCAAGCLQRPLVPRSRFRQQLKPGVDMTSDVKSWRPLFSHVLCPIVLRPSEEPEPVIYDG